MTRARPFASSFKAACEAEGLALLPVRIETNPRADGVVVTLALRVEVDGPAIAADDVQAARGAIRALRGRVSKLFKLDEGKQRCLPGM